MVVRYSSHFPTTFGGSTPPPCLCIYIDIVEICPDLVICIFWVCICMGRGGVDPPEVVGRLDRYLTSARQNAPQNQYFLVADLTDPCMCIPDRHFFVLSCGCQVLVPLPNHFRRVDPPPYLCIYIDIVEICPDLVICIMTKLVRWLSGTRPTSQPLSEGRPPPYLCIYIDIVQICPDLVICIFGYVYAWVGGGGRPSGSGWEVGQVPDNHLTSARQNGPQNQDFLVADLTDPCMCIPDIHFFVLSGGCQVLVPLPNHFRRVDPPPAYAYT